MFSLKELGSVSHDKLEVVEIPIFGLDCHACSLAVHDILAKVEGVQHVTASFHDGFAKAWIDPAATDRSKLEESLKSRGVQITQ